MNKLDNHAINFKKNGYTIASDIFEKESFAEIEYDITQSLIKFCNEFDLKCKKSKTASQIILELESIAPGAALSFMNNYIYGWPIYKIMKSTKLLKIANSILGEEIDIHPFKSLRTKMPNAKPFDVPWHQDSSYLSKDANSSSIITIWVPLVDITLHNGCIEICEISNDQLSEIKHNIHSTKEFNSWYTKIDNNYLKSFNRRIVNIKKGSALIFDKFTPHRSLPNLSSNCRFSLDFRYITKSHFPGTNQNSIPILRNGNIHASFEKLRKTVTEKKKKQKFKKNYLIENPIWLDRWKT